MRKVTIRFADDDIDGLDRWAHDHPDPETGEPRSRAAALRAIVRRALRGPQSPTENTPATRADLHTAVSAILTRLPANGGKHGAPARPGTPARPLLRRR